MKTQHYTLYVKSHVDGWSDFKDECEAISKLQATRIFLRRMGGYSGVDPTNDKTYSSADGWDEKSLYQYVASDEEML